MKKIFLLHLLCFAFGIPLLMGQHKANPDFLIRNQPADSLTKSEILQALKSYTCQPTESQKREILTSIIEQDTSLLDHESYFLTLASYFIDVFDVEMQEEFNRVVTQGLDSTGGDWAEQVNSMYHFPLTLDEWSPLHEYDFRCLDFNEDGVIDMIVFSQIYFGPSLGLVFYGRQEDGYRYLFDCSGEFYSLQKKDNKLYMHYIVTIIDGSETEILAGLVFDFKSGFSYLESKLYMAQQMQIPDKLNAPSPFLTMDSVYLRWCPKVNNKEHVRDDMGYSTDDSLSSTLFGNVLAVFPESAEGLVLATQKDWAFVVFSAKVNPLRSSLSHGLDNACWNEESGAFFSISPQQYWCGWIERKFIQK